MDRAQGTCLHVDSCTQNMHLSCCHRVQACFQRNVHSRTLEDIQSMAAQWEQPPLAYPQLDFAPLLQPRQSEAQVCKPACLCSCLPNHLCITAFKNAFMHMRYCAEPGLCLTQQEACTCVQITVTAPFSAKAEQAQQ